MLVRDRPAGYGPCVFDGALYKAKKEPNTFSAEVVVWRNCDSTAKEPTPMRQDRTR